jgi:glutaminyl-peptide cyclotransferase
MKVRGPLVIALLVGAGVVGFLGSPSATDRASSRAPVSRAPRRTNADATPPKIPFNASTPRVIFPAVSSLPHDTAAFTEGLLIHNGRLLESTGLEGHSDIRDIDRRSGAVLRRAALNTALFGEGIAVVGARLFQLTWQNGRGYIYDAASFAPLDSFAFSGEGWGMTSDGQKLFMSDGSSTIKVVAADGFRIERTFEVTEAGQPVWMLNELEWVRGELWANVYQTDFIARIDAGNGAVIGWIDLFGLLTPEQRSVAGARGGVANGIAYDAARDEILVTGKMWPRVFVADRHSLVGASAAQSASALR